MEIGGKWDGSLFQKIKNGNWDGSLFQKIKNIKTKKGPALENGTVLFSKIGIGTAF